MTGDLACLASLACLAVSAAGAADPRREAAPSSRAGVLERAVAPRLPPERCGPAPGPLLDALATATWEGIKAMVEACNPSVQPCVGQDGPGLPHDRIDRFLLDVVPQLAVVRPRPRTDQGGGGSITATRWPETGSTCPPGLYSLRLDYDVSVSPAWVSYNIEPPLFDVSAASSGTIQVRIRGEVGGERIRIVLWDSDLWPNPPAEAVLPPAETVWRTYTIPLDRYNLRLDALRRLSIDTNDGICQGGPCAGSIYVDEIAFLDDQGARIHVPVNECTGLANIGIYVAGTIAACELTLASEPETLERLENVVAALERLPRCAGHGLMQTHHGAYTLEPGGCETCIASVDTGVLAAGLAVLRSWPPAAALEGRVDAILDGLDWPHLYDPAPPPSQPRSCPSCGLHYGCRYMDGAGGCDAASTFYSDWLAADSILAYVFGIGAEVNPIPACAWENLRRSCQTPICQGPGPAPLLEPGWYGGGLFMPLMPRLFLGTGDVIGQVLERAGRSLLEDQRRFAAASALPAWGWSATTMPDGYQYCGYGCCDMFNFDPTCSMYAGCGPRDPGLPPVAIFVPHASVLGGEIVGEAELEANLGALRVLGAWPPVCDGLATRPDGFGAVSSVRADGEASTAYLMWDQGMSLVALANLQRAEAIRRLFGADARVRRAVAAVEAGLAADPGNLLMATKVGDDAYLEFPPAVGTGWRIYRDPDRHSIGTRGLADVAAPRHTDTGVIQDGRTHYYAVRGLSACGMPGRPAPPPLCPP